MASKFPHQPPVSELLNWDSGFHRQLTTRHHPGDVYFACKCVRHIVAICDVSLSPDCAIPNVMWTRTDLCESRMLWVFHRRQRSHLFCTFCHKSFHCEDHVCVHTMNLHKMNLGLIDKTGPRVDLEGRVSTQSLVQHKLAWTGFQGQCGRRFPITLVTW